MLPDSSYRTLAAGSATPQVPHGAPWPRTARGPASWVKGLALGGAYGLGVFMRRSIAERRSFSESVCRFRGSDGARSGRLVKRARALVAPNRRDKESADPHRA